MPLRQFILRHNPDRGLPRGMNVTMCYDGTFDVKDLSSIRFPKVIISQDIWALKFNFHRQCTLAIDLRDLDGNHLKINNSDDCVFVEGKREQFDGKTWIQHQICRRIPMPQGCKVKSVHYKLMQPGILLLTVTMRYIDEPYEDTTPNTKTVLICSGVAADRSRSATGLVKVNLTKIQPKVVNYAISDPPPQCVSFAECPQQVGYRRCSAVSRPVVRNIYLSNEEGLRQVEQLFRTLNTGFIARTQNNYANEEDLRLVEQMISNCNRNEITSSNDEVNVLMDSVIDAAIERVRSLLAAPGSRRAELSIEVKLELGSEEEEKAYETNHSRSSNFYVY